MIKCTWPTRVKLSCLLKINVGIFKIISIFIVIIIIIGIFKTILIAIIIEPMPT